MGLRNDPFSKMAIIGVLLLSLRMGMTSQEVKVEESSSSSTSEASVRSFFSFEDSVYSTYYNIFHDEKYPPILLGGIRTREDDSKTASSTSTSEKPPSAEPLVDRQTPPLPSVYFNDDHSKILFSPVHRRRPRRPKFGTRISPKGEDSLTKGSLFGREFALLGLDSVLRKDRKEESKGEDTLPSSSTENSTKLNDASSSTPPTETTTETSNNYTTPSTTSASFDMTTMLTEKEDEEKLPKTDVVQSFQNVRDDKSFELVEGLSINETEVNLDNSSNSTSFIAFNETSVADVVSEDKQSLSIDLESERKSNYTHETKFSNDTDFQIKNNSSPILETTYELTTLDPLIDLDESAIAVFNHSVPSMEDDNVWTNTSSSMYEESDDLNNELLVNSSLNDTLQINESDDVANPTPAFDYEDVVLSRRDEVKHNFTTIPDDELTSLLNSNLNTSDYEAVSSSNTTDENIDSEGKNYEVLSSNDFIFFEEDFYESTPNTSQSTLADLTLLEEDKLFQPSQSKKTKSFEHATENITTMLPPEHQNEDVYNSTRGKEESIQISGESGSLLVNDSYRSFVTNGSILNESIHSKMVTLNPKDSVDNETVIDIPEDDELYETTPQSYANETDSAFNFSQSSFDQALNEATTISFVNDTDLTFNFSQSSLNHVLNEATTKSFVNDTDLTFNSVQNAFDQDVKSINASIDSPTLDPSVLNNNSLQKINSSLLSKVDDIPLTTEQISTSTPFDSSIIQDNKTSALSTDSEDTTLSNLIDHTTESILMSTNVEVQTDRSMILSLENDDKNIEAELTTKVPYSLFTTIIPTIVQESTKIEENISSTSSPEDPKSHIQDISKKQDFTYDSLDNSTNIYSEINLTFFEEEITTEFFPVEKIASLPDDIETSKIEERKTNGNNTENLIIFDEIPTFEMVTDIFDVDDSPVDYYIEKIYLNDDEPLAFSTPDTDFTDIEFKIEEPNATIVLDNGIVKLSIETFIEDESPISSTHESSTVHSEVMAVPILNRLLKGNEAPSIDQTEDALSVESPTVIPADEIKDFIGLDTRLADPLDEPSLPLVHSMLLNTLHENLQDLSEDRIMMLENEVVHLISSLDSFINTNVIDLQDLLRSSKRNRNETIVETIMRSNALRAKTNLIQSTRKGSKKKVFIPEPLKSLLQNEESNDLSHILSLMSIKNPKSMSALLSGIFDVNESVDQRVIMEELLEIISKDPLTVGQAFGSLIFDLAKSQESENPFTELSQIPDEEEKMPTSPSPEPLTGAPTSFLSTLVQFIKSGSLSTKEIIEELINSGILPVEVTRVGKIPIVVGLETPSKVSSVPKSGEFEEVDIYDPDFDYEEFNLNSFFETTTTYNNEYNEDNQNSEFAMDTTTKKTSTTTEAFSSTLNTFTPSFQEITSTKDTLTTNDSYVDIPTTTDSMIDTPTTTPSQDIEDVTSPPILFNPHLTEIYGEIKHFEEGLLTTQIPALIHGETTQQSDSTTEATTSEPIQVNVTQETIPSDLATPNKTTTLIVDNATESSSQSSEVESLNEVFIENLNEKKTQDFSTLSPLSMSPLNSDQLRLQSTTPDQSQTFGIFPTQTLSSKKTRPAIISALDSDEPLIKNGPNDRELDAILSVLRLYKQGVLSDSEFLDIISEMDNNSENKASPQALPRMDERPRHINQRKNSGFMHAFISDFPNAFTEFSRSKFGDQDDKLSYSSRDYFNSKGTDKDFQTFSYTNHPPYPREPFRPSQVF